MPEYLSPGVFIEEIPSSLRAIEGVSTSTAAFVGRARRGTVPGYAWPSSAHAQSAVHADRRVRAHARPRARAGDELCRVPARVRPAAADLPPDDDPNDYGYLGWAVRAFFDNGGKRAFIARIVDPTDNAEHDAAGARRRLPPRALGLAGDRQDGLSHIDARSERRRRRDLHAPLRRAEPARHPGAAGGRGRGHRAACPPHWRPIDHG